MMLWGIGGSPAWVWKSFLRGQLMIVILVMISYTILLTILGVRYAYAIAILAGLARFVPYVGPAITHIVLGLVIFFQGSNYFNLTPFFYTALVIVLSIILDQIYDSLVSPRIMGKSLGVHPAAVLVVAILSARLIGLIGLHTVFWLHREAFMGIQIGEREYWSKGYGTDALRVLLRYAFNELSLARISLSVLEGNARAMRSYEKCGFKYEGRERQAWIYDGRRWDEVYMGLLREEWQTMRDEQ